MNSNVNKSLNITSLPLSFELNKGQFSSDARYIARTINSTTLIHDKEIIIKDFNNKIKISFLNSDINMKIVTGYELEGKANYLIGSDSSKWITDVPMYSSVKYSNAYQGIDIVCYGKGKVLEFDGIISAGADYKQIELKIESPMKLSEDELGNIVFRDNNSEMKLIKPYCYQMINGQKTEIESKYDVLDENSIKFNVGGYDNTKELIIDPVLIYSTYLGGNESQFGEGGYAIDTDSSGNVYVAGYTNSYDFPIENPYQGTLNGLYNAFVTKLNSTGSKLIYSTYIGGSGSDYGVALTLDKSNHVYLTGNTSSTDFPIVNPYQSDLKGGVNAFALKLNTTGNTLVYSTYLGGSKEDYGTGIGVDDIGNAYIGGYTSSVDYPIIAAYQENLLGVENAFVTKLSNLGNAIIFSTYIGGRGKDNTKALDLDANNNIFITGYTTSSNFPTVHAFQPTLGGMRDAFVTEIDKSGRSLIFSTYYGGMADDFGNDIAVDNNGNIYVTGSTSSSNLYTKNSFQSNLLGSSNAFVLKLVPSGAGVDFATYFGGTGFDYANCISLDGTSGLYITGGTTSSDFPIINAIQPVNMGNTDAFISKLSNDGSELFFSTFLGGSQVDFGNCISCGPDKSVNVTGVTFSNNFPLEKPYQGLMEGIVDVFVAKLIDTVNLVISKEAPSESYIGEIIEYNITVKNDSLTTLTSVVATDYLPFNCEFISIEVSKGVASLLGKVITWNVGNMSASEEVTATIQVKVLVCGELVNKAIATDDRENESEAIVSTKVVSMLTTGPVQLNKIRYKRTEKDNSCCCNDYNNCSYDWHYNNNIEKYTSISLIENISDLPVTLEVMLYNLEASSQVPQKSKTITILPHKTKTVVFEKVPKLYKITFDKVTAGIFIWTSIKLHVTNCDMTNSMLLDINTFTQNDLINVTNC